MSPCVNERIAAAVARALPQLEALRDELYRHPEIGGEETFASSRLTEVLEENGFQVTREYGGIPHAFRAAASAPVSGPTVALFAEYDALPDLGHACGHNLICTAALGAALALREVLPDLRGMVVVFGTPGEENLCTKTLLAERGLLDEADAAMMVHPNPVTCASGRTRAVESLQVEFFGRSAHAGTGDRQGINALDAAVACYQKIQAEKTRYPDTNVHGILNDGGQKASVIPGYSSLKYLTRAWDMEGLRALRAMVERCAAAAAAETGCTYRIHNNEATNRPMRTNQTLSQVFNRISARLRGAGDPPPGRDRLHGHGGRQLAGPRHPPLGGPELPGHPPAHGGLCGKDPVPGGGWLPLPVQPGHGQHGGGDPDGRGPAGADPGRVRGHTGSVSAAGGGAARRAAGCFPGNRRDMAAGRACGGGQFWV